MSDGSCSGVWTLMPLTMRPRIARAIDGDSSHGRHDVTPQEVVTNHKSRSGNVHQGNERINRHHTPGQRWDLKQRAHQPQYHSAQSDRQGHGKDGVVPQEADNCAVKAGADEYWQTDGDDGD